MKKVLITTIPFGDKNKLPLDLLEKNGCEYVINPLNKNLQDFSVSFWFRTTQKDSKNEIL